MNGRGGKTSWKNNSTKVTSWVGLLPLGPYHPSQSTLDSRATALNKFLLEANPRKAFDCLSLGHLPNPWITMNYKRETSSALTSLGYGAVSPDRTHLLVDILNEKGGSDTGLPSHASSSYFQVSQDGGVPSVTLGYLLPLIAG